MADLLTADAPGVAGVFGSAQWGIFDQGGSPLLETDAVASVEYIRDYNVSDYPQELGAFQSYNKVQVPYQAKVGFFIGQSRNDFLNAIEAAVKSLTLVTVVTPEIQYPNANLTHYAYRRDSQHGVTLIRVDVWCEEIRIPSQPAGNGQISSDAAGTGSNNGASPTQSGQLQPGQTKQNDPVATADLVGGSFTPVGQVSTSTTTSDLSLQGSTSGSFMTLPDAPNTTGSPTIPAGVPNTTGGGESSTTTFPEDVTVGGSIIGL